MNHFRLRARSHHDVSLIRREQCAEHLKRAELAKADAQLTRASVALAQGQTDAFQRLSEAYEAQGRENDELRKASECSLRSGDNMTRAYELLLLERAEVARYLMQG